MMETYIGVVTHYYNHLGVAIVSLTGELRASEVIHFQGHSTDFYQEAWSMEKSHHQIEQGQAGEEIAVKVISQVHEGDKVFLAPEATPTDPTEIDEQTQDEWVR